MAQRHEHDEAAPFVPPARRSGSVFLGSIDVAALEQVMADADTFEACVAQAMARAPGAPEGFFGPGSMVWRMFGELAVNLGGFRAVAMQIVHPAVAASGVANQRFREGFLLRSLRSFATVSEIAFGSVDVAIAASRRLHVMHSMVRGTYSEAASARRAGEPYRANDPRSLLWVLVTLYEASVFSHECFVGPVSGAERARYWEEFRLLGLLHGVPPDVLPGTVADFEGYWREMHDSGELEAAPAAVELMRQVAAETPGRALLRLPGTPLGWVDDAWLGGTMAPEWARRLGIECSVAQRRGFERFCRGCRAVVANTPVSARRSPAFHQATLRVAEARGERASVAARLVDRVSARYSLPFDLKKTAVLIGDMHQVHQDLFG